jgi:hypothetical protein
MALRTQPSALLQSCTCCCALGRLVHRVQIPSCPCADLRVQCCSAYSAVSHVWGHTQPYHGLSSGLMMARCTCSPQQPNPALLVQPSSSCVNVRSEAARLHPVSLPIPVALTWPPPSAMQAQLRHSNNVPPAPCMGPLPGPFPSFPRIPPPSMPGRQHRKGPAMEGRRIEKNAACMRVCSTAQLRSSKPIHIPAHFSLALRHASLESAPQTLRIAHYRFHWAPLVLPVDNLLLCSCRLPSCFLERCHTGMQPL